MRYFKYNIFGLNVNILGEIKKPALKKCSCKSVAMFGNVMAMFGNVRYNVIQVTENEN